MQQDKPKVTYYVVPYQTFQNAANKLAEMPYKQVADAIQELASQSRAMYGKLPATPKFQGPGGQVVTDTPANGNGKEPDTPASETDKDPERKTFFKRALLTDSLIEYYVDTREPVIDAGQKGEGSAES